MLGMVGKMGVSDGGKNAGMAENLLDFQQCYAGFQQVRGIAVTQAVRRNLFLKPHSLATFLNVICTPPLANGVAAVALPFKPDLRLGNSQFALRCTAQKRRNNK